MLDRGALVRSWKSISTRRPAVPVAIAFVLGIAAEHLLPVWPVRWIALGAVAVVAACGSRRWVPASLCLLVAIVLAGLVAAELETNYFDGNEIGQFTTDGPRLAQLELRILSPPRLLTESVLSRPLPPRQVCRAEVRKVRTTSGWQAGSGDVSLTVDQPHPQLAVGQVVVATGTLQRPMAAANPGQRDWAAFYREDRILVLMTVPHADALRIVEAAPAMPREWLREKARQLLADGFGAGRARDFALMQALALGDRDASTRDAQDDFAQSGTAHLLAVSGLHIVLVGAAALFLLGRLFGLHPRTATLVAMVVVLLYAFAVVPGTPSVRATVLCVAYGINRLARRRPDGLQLLALCALAILVWHPHDLSSAGFQLSFVTVAGIILGSRRMAEMLNDLLEDEHTRVARSFRPPIGRAAFMLACRGRLVDVVAMSLVAWAVSLPLIMIHFGQANPWATLTGVLALPFVVVALLAGLLKIVLTLALPSLAGAWAVVCVGPTVLLGHLVHWLARWPGANLAAAAPPPWKLLAIYGLLALPLLPWSWAFVRRLVKLSPVAGCFVALLPTLLGARAAPIASGDVRVTLLAIGAGQIGVIELPNRHVVLIDDGSNSVPDPLRQCLAPYLRSRGIVDVDAIVLSHPDYDHFSAAADTAEAFHPGRVIVSPVFRGQAQGNEPAVDMLNRFDALHVPVETVARGGHVVLSDEAALDVLWPPADRRFTSTNNAGLVLRLSCRGRSVLFPADIQIPTERELLQSAAALRSDVLVAPHHGSAETTTPEFLAAVRPLDVLCSNAVRLSKKQREFDELAAGYAVYRTSRFGAVTACIGVDGAVRIETFLHAGTRERK